MRRASRLHLSLCLPVHWATTIFISHARSKVLAPDTFQNFIRSYFLLSHLVEEIDFPCFLDIYLGVTHKLELSGVGVGLFFSPPLNNFSYAWTLTHTLPITYALPCRKPFPSFCNRYRVCWSFALQKRRKPTLFTHISIGHSSLLGVGLVPSIS